MIGFDGNYELHPTVEDNVQYAKKSLPHYKALNRVVTNLLKSAFKAMRAG